jgi:hypothetical protein
MIDTGTGLTALGVALGGKDIIVKLLGPTAEYIGDEAKEFTRKRFENVKNIFSNAIKKSGNKLETETGTVSPKVLKGIIDEGSYSDDFLTTEYFGGVLASSRTGISRDDRGAYFNSIISRLSAYQLRFHYLVYHLIKLIFNKEVLNVGLEDNRQKLRIFIPFDTYLIGMEFFGPEERESGNILTHILTGLTKEGLLDNFYQYGDVNFLKTRFPGIDRGGVVVEPSILGIELFLWAYGLGQRSINDYLKENIIFDLDNKVKIIGAYKRINDQK